MGSWGPGSFQNDPALDFLGDLNESADGAPLRDELQRIIAKADQKELLFPFHGTENYPVFDERPLAGCTNFILRVRRGSAIVLPCLASMY